MRIFPFTIAFSLICALQAQKIVKFGAIFDKDDVFGLNVFDLAITRQNVFNSKLRLVPLIKRIPSMDAAKVEKAVCELVDSGAVAIIGPKSIYMSDIVASLCNELNIPHIAIYHRTREISKNLYHKFTRNIFPDSTLLSRSLVEVLKNFAWKRFAIIYDSDESLIRLNGVIQMFPFGFKLVNIYKFPKNKNDMKVILKQISRSYEQRIIIDCSLENIAEIIRQGAEVKMMTEYMMYFITFPDGHMLNVPELNTVTANISAIRLMTEDDIEANNIVNNWKNTKMYLNAEQSRIAEEIASPNRLKIEAALIRDSITVLATALKQNRLFINIDEPSTRCSALDNGNQTWIGGVELLKSIDEGSANGITGPIDFDRDFKTRQNFYMEIIELDKAKIRTFQKTAEWNARSGLILTRTLKQLESQRNTSIQSKNFRVVTRLDMPYLRRKRNDDGTILTGNDRYEGFIKDLLDEIAKLKKFSYVLLEAPGNHLGKYDKHSGKWDGVIGFLLNNDADLAACDFTITHERKLYIDFSIPFMNLGIGILYAKPRVDPPEFLLFLKPLDITVWLNMCTAALCVALSVYVVSKLSLRDWLNPHPCDDEPEELENAWNMRNCFWVVAGAPMQQGCDILPKGFGTRLVVASWWFFALIVINSYTASLAAHLTKSQLAVSISSAEDLSKGHSIKYGVMKEGSTEEFFKYSNVTIYQKMYAAMEHFEPNVFLKDNEEGIERVKKDNGAFAYFMESSTINYITQKECDLMAVGPKLDEKSYGIGMPLNSPYRDDINQAILKLKEDRTIKRLRDKWWITLNVPIKDGVEQNCTKEEKSESLDIAHIYGIYVVLAMGIVLSIIAGIIEFLWNVRKISIAQKITPREALRSELMFALKVWLTRKPVKHESSELRESLSSSRSSEKS